MTIAAGPPSGTPSVWVLQPDDTLAMYDTKTFHPWQSFKLPAGARKHPEAISISRDRMVLFAYPQDGSTALARFWSSNPYAREFVAGASERRPAPGGGYNILSATPAVYFSADGQRLFWFEHREQRLTRGPDISRDARFLAWTTDLTDQNPKQVAEFEFAPCKCETGACSETCPEALAWAPPGGVSDFFFVTRWVPGQSGSDWLQTTVYQLTNGAWTAHLLPHPIEHFLDAGDRGNVYVEAVDDAGCCGWSNESDDITTVVSGAVNATVFDEQKRFENRDYDVSFFTANAAVSPDAKRVAYTIDHSFVPEGEIRLSSEGKDNAGELQRIKNSIAEMPMVEAHGILSSGVLVSIPHAELVGWTDDAHLLIVAGGELKTVELSTGKQSSTGIKADAAKYVFLR